MLLLALLVCQSWYGHVIKLLVYVEYADNIQGFASNNAVRYFGIFLVTGGTTANFPAIMAYQVTLPLPAFKVTKLTANLLGKQRARSMETSIFQRLSRCSWEHWRDSWVVGVQDPRRANVSPRNMGSHCMQPDDNCYCLHYDALLPYLQQKG